LNYLENFHGNFTKLGAYNYPILNRMLTL